MCPALTDDDHERWAAECESYAYITIRDGPDNDDDEIAPKEPPPAGNPSFYSFDPGRFTNSSGVQPSRAGRRGAQRHNGRYETRNFWELRSALPLDAAPHEHVKNILGLLSSNWAEFVKAGETHRICLHIVIKGQNPGIAIDRIELSRLAELRASLDVDAYGTGSAEA